MRRKPGIHLSPRKDAFAGLTWWFDMVIFDPWGFGESQGIHDSAILNTAERCLSPRDTGVIAHETGLRIPHPQGTCLGLLAG